MKSAVGATIHSFKPPTSTQRPETSTAAPVAVWKVVIISALMTGASMMGAAATPVAPHVPEPALPPHRPRGRGRPRPTPFSVTDTHIANTSTLERFGRYSYAPSGYWKAVSNVKKLFGYFCGANSNPDIGGDYIYAFTGDGLHGPFHGLGDDGMTSGGSISAVFGPAGGNTWDGQDTCDPSVLEGHRMFRSITAPWARNATALMYYGGFPIAGTEAAQFTKIGIAVRYGGNQFVRLDNSGPLLGPARNNTPGLYGIGQPSVVFRHPYFYMLATDTTGPGRFAPNTNQLVLFRSPDPLFQRDIKQLADSPAGRIFARFNQKSSTMASLGEFASSDLQWHQASQRWIVANDVEDRGIQLSFFDANFNKIQKPITLAGLSEDGPGLFGTPLHYSLAAAADGTTPLHLMRAVPTDSCTPAQKQLGTSTVADPYCWGLATGKTSLITDAKRASPRSRP